MTEEDILFLKRNVDRLVRFIFDDGEVMVAKILFISEEDQDVICDLISTTKDPATKNTITNLPIASNSNT